MLQAHRSPGFHHLLLVQRRGSSQHVLVPVKLTQIWTYVQNLLPDLLLEELHTHSGPELPLMGSTGASRVDVRTRLGLLRCRAKGHRLIPLSCKGHWYSLSSWSAEAVVAVVGRRSLVSTKLSHTHNLTFLDLRVTVRVRSRGSPSGTCSATSLNLGWILLFVATSPKGLSQKVLTQQSFTTRVL